MSRRRQPQQWQPQPNLQQLRLQRQPRFRQQLHLQRQPQLPLLLLQPHCLQFRQLSRHVAIQVDNAMLLWSQLEQRLPICSRSEQLFKRIWLYRKQTKLQRRLACLFSMLFFTIHARQTASIQCIGDFKTERAIRQKGFAVWKVCLWLCEGSAIVWFGDMLTVLWLSTGFSLYSFFLSLFLCRLPSKHACHSSRLQTTTKNSCLTASKPSIWPWLDWQLYTPTTNQWWEYMASLHVGNFKFQNGWTGAPVL